MSNNGRASWVGFAAAFWALAFAGLHVAWATGWYIGLAEQQARAAFARPWFLAYDLIVVVLCVLAGLLALAMVRPWGQRLPRRWVGLAAGVGTVILALRGGLAIAYQAHAVTTGSFVFHPMQVWDAWFCLGALLFGLATWTYLIRARRRSLVA